VHDDDKPTACAVARRLRAMGFEIVATAGTAKALERARVPTTVVRKVLDGSPHVVDAIRAGEIAMVVNTTIGAQSIRDSYSIRRSALMANIPHFTNMSTALSAIEAMEMSAAADDEGHEKPLRAVKSLQEWHARMA
jgi:carbamoyl-phosphate synthase large subunit